VHDEWLVYNIKEMSHKDLEDELVTLNKLLIGFRKYLIKK
jgi:hypothetical protein